MNPQNFSTPLKGTDAPAVMVGLVVSAGSGAGEGWKTLAHVEEMLGRFGLGSERWETDALPVGNAHQQHLADGMTRGWRALIVSSPNAALPQALAAAWTLPVIRVPTGGSPGEVDALRLLWPEPEEEGAAGAAFATVAIGEAGAKNAALLVVSMLALEDATLRRALEEFRREQTATVLASVLPTDR